MTKRGKKNVPYGMTRTAEILSVEDLLSMLLKASFLILLCGILMLLQIIGGPS